MGQQTTRGAMWLRLLTGGAHALHDWPSVQVCDAPLAGQPARWIAVVPDPANRFPRARNGEVGLVDACVADDTAEIRATVMRLFAQGRPEKHRSDQAREYLARLERLDTSAQPSPADVRALYAQGDA